MADLMDMKERNTNNLFTVTFIINQTVLLAHF